MTHRLPFKLLLAAASVVASAAFAQAPPVPQWQITAGGKMSFDVVSVRPSKPDAQWGDNVNMTDLDGDYHTGGLLTSNGPLMRDILFAYKIGDFSQYQSMGAQLPKWAQTDPFDIQARAGGNPSKDQMRLMMQSLLEDRFKLAIHVESRQLPVYALVLDKHNKLGPQLQPHPDNLSCPDPTQPGPAVKDPAVRSVLCGISYGWTEDGQSHVRMINVTMQQIADHIGLQGHGAGGLDERPTLDQTGLAGRFDFDLIFTPEPNGPQPSAADSQPEAPGPRFAEALENQLGLKLIKQTGAVNVYVIDHVERPSEN
jgi:uncharacterized protein (TIGR03435 family)